MKTFNTYYKDAEQFRCFLHDNAIVDTPNMLVQIFCAMNDVEIIEALLQTVTELLPSCHVIGATTDGEILNATVSIHKIIISVTEFEKTTLQSFGVERESGCASLGESMGRAIVTPSTKAIITFTDGANTNGEEYLEGLNTYAYNATVAGGLAGDVFKLGKTYVFTRELITNNGAVGVSLNSESLHVHTDYNFNWTPIGKELTITYAEHNRVYSIDEKTACEAYAYYLGDDVASKIPNINIEFPLILEKHGVSIARAALARKEDDSIVFAGNLQTGDKVRIGFGNTELILKDASRSYEEAKNRPIESVFIYSCMARRRYMQEACSLEIEPWANIAPLCGFFTYGEFFTNASLEKFLMNQTMTILVLSENATAHEYSSAKKTINISKRMLDFANSMKALSHFVNITTEELVSLNRRLNRAIDGSKDGLWNWNLETNDIYFSPRFKQILGYEDDEFSNSFDGCMERLHPEDKERILTSIKSCRAGEKEEYNEIFRMKHKNGSWIWIHSRGMFFYNETGKIIRASGFHTDVTEEKTQSLEKEEQRRFFQSIINGIDASVIVVDKEENILVSNKNASHFFIETLFADPQNPTYKELYFQTPLHQIDNTALYPMQKALSRGEVISAIVKRVNTSRQLCDIEITITPLLDASGSLMGAIEVGHDISEYLALQQELEVQKQHLKHLAHHDALTGLPNRLIFSDRLGVAMSQAERRVENIAILFIDLDHFKHINDTIGHEFGDAVLKTVAKRFSMNMRASDTVVRLGGDEFIVILDQIHHREEIVTIVEKILAQASLPILYKEQKLQVCASVGIAVFPEDGNDETTLLKNADKAMYQAKEKGGNTYCFFGNNDLK